MTDPLRQDKPAGRRRLQCALVIAVVGIMLSGCVEREERIKVDRDGAVTILLDYTADTDEELYVGRVPPNRYGWRTRRWTEDQSDGSVKYRMEALRRIAFGEDLPGTYSDPASGEQDLYLEFPTSLVVEVRPDGVYYHFERLYVKRDWAYLEDITTETLIKEDAEGLAAKATDELSDSERIRLLEVMTRVETLKRLAMARRAYQTITPTDPPDGWLRTRDDLLAAIEEFDYSRINDILESGDTTAGQDAIDAITEAYEVEMDGRITLGLLTYCGYTDSQARAFDRAYDWHKRHLKYTQDLNSEGLRIAVEMPGEIVASNADEQTDNQAVWRFKGEWLHDRDRELLVTSRVRN
ncbi:MAG: hypothetical protein D8M59_07885 [Planctomycetes bacterium]|nr:hypothetical protein [Planctomycetota bacterium]NOG53244.1 hypothetical protein [Planctomycetota bacterium]